MFTVHPRVKRLQPDVRFESCPSRRYFIAFFDVHKVKMDDVNDQLLGHYTIAPTDALLTPFDLRKTYNLPVTKATVNA